MTDPNPQSVVRDAVSAAGRAAAVAGVRIRELHELTEMREACLLLDRVWRPEPDNPLMTPELLRVVAHSGSYAVGAYEDGRMVGACLGFLATAGLHSHIAAVEGVTRGRNVGFAVKLHQRAWSLERGITTVTWTYDPLVARNAYFNLAKLGATPSEYLSNFYGAMRDEVNAGTETDRLLVHWELAGERSARACAGLPAALDLAGLGAEPVVGLDAKPDGRPVAGRGDGEVVLVRVPSDIEALRRADPEAARDWRSAVREVLGGLMSEGRAVTGFVRDGWYVIERPREGRS
ncbi:GNAT family N-acetyltransferase [Streptomyces spiramyceticus]|uniref:GNAT family N-acetyltransferase n=1 Tax=Streptomyces spiramyceticus TaxID=299717 RepID=UPI00237A2527|nr:GNAT family N-acetyltransferase [Streptomyces spiramyceticus]